MKIGIDISSINVSKRTGIPNYIFELSKKLIEIDKKDSFTMFGISTIQTYNYLKDIEFGKNKNVTVKIIRWPAKFFRYTFLLWQKLYFPPIELFTGDLNIYHSFNWYHAPTFKAKSIATVFDLTSLNHPEWHKKRTTQLDSVFIKTCAKHADIIITISESTKNDFLKRYPGKRVEVVYPGVAPIFKPTIDRKLNAKVLKKYNLDSGYILSVGTLEPRKNLSSLIKAFGALNPQEKLVLVGPKGWKTGELETLIEHHKDKVKVLGYVPDKELPSLYQEALCLVYPSFYEGFGIPILEAMSCGTPVIISNTSSMPEVGGKAAVYINPHSVTSIEKALRKFIEDPLLKMKYKKLVLEQSKKFSWKKSAEKLMKIYHSL